MLNAIDELGYAIKWCLLDWYQYGIKPTRKNFIMNKEVWRAMQ